MAQFVPRRTFVAPNSIPKTYYLGHHAAGHSKMVKEINRVNLVLECRDARIPLTSQNPTLERTIAGRERLIIYTKSDFTSHSPHAMNALRKMYGDRVVFWDKMRPTTTLHLLKKIKDSARAHDSLVGLRVMVVGVPNVGKSSLLNSLRFKGIPSKTAKVAKTGSQAGITRKISTNVRILPPESKKGGVGQNGAFVLDTPGIFQPYVNDGETMLKIALVQGIKDGLIQDEVLADYLLYQINLFKPALYEKYCGPTNDLDEFLSAVASKEGMLKAGGVPDLRTAATRVLSLWRKGELGRFVLDDLSDKGLEEHQQHVLNPPLSMNQAKKQKREARAQEKAGA
ncbi:hypothetical protein F53441_10579 [Fusarium austroafricanum]|uniref:Mitochondrial GTPase 1 n=1 Tax=Fusarium austroafricanum TaxID=2364996 RepID=A0A8H4K6P9_9HYPO|nr:hypothetical protein F53441_10579 [Fusarium austroafricanum]